MNDIVNREKDFHENYFSKFTVRQSQSKWYEPISRSVLTN